MKKTGDHRNSRFCLTLCCVVGISSPVFAQGWGGDWRGRSDDRGRSGWDDRGGGDREGGFRGWDRGRSRGFGGSDGGGYGGFGGGGFGGGGWGGPDGDSRGEYGRDSGRGHEGGDRGSSSSTSPQQVVLKPHERVTVDLPAAFIEGDRDGDGQIGFYEWRQWKRGEFETFLALDHNRDGFLTPSELAKGPKAIMAAAPAGSSTPAGIASAPAAATGSPALPSQPVSTSPASDHPLLGRAEGTFQLMDRNRDGNLDQQEWARSTKLKPKFEAAGIDLSKPMSKPDFVGHFLKIEGSAT